MKKITIEDVAAKAGVSKGTVSAVINAKNTVKPSTRDSVLQVMKELNFRPKAVARNLKNGVVDNSIGLIIKDLNNPFYTEIALGVKEYANNKGYLVVITSSENIHEHEQKFSHLFSTKDIKGTIIAPIVEGTAEIEHLFKLKMINYPFVLLEDVQGIQANVVSVNNNKAVRKAVKYLIDNGHERIVHFTGPENASHTIERINAFRQAFSETPLVFSKDMIVPADAHFEESKKVCLDFFKGKTKKQYPTAIVCFNDQQAFGVLAALKDLKIRVPDDVSVVGNDDIYYSQLYPVPLTTIRAPKKEMGRKAAEILIKNIESSKILPTERIELETEFVVRESTKKISK